MKRLWTLLFLLLAVPAVAGNATVVDSICAFAGFRDIGITAYFHGDDDSNNTFVGLIRKHGIQPYDTLMFFRSTTMQPEFPNRTKRYWAASAMMLSAQTAYDFHWAFGDAGGVSSNHAGDTTFMTPTEIDKDHFSTLACKGKQYFIGPFGADANSGTDASHPLATFPTALGKMSGLGDQLVVLAGGPIYLQRADSLNVTADSKNGDGTHYYSVVGQRGATISGADTLALAGSGWGTKDIGGVTVNVFDFRTHRCWPREVVIDDTLRLYPYTSFFRFKTDPLGLARKSGCFWATAKGESVFIRTPLGTSMTGHTIEVPTRASAFRIESAFWRVDSLRFRAFGTGHDVGLTGSTVNMGNQGCVVENCTFLDLGRPAIGIRNYFGATERRHGWCTVQYDSFLTHTLGQSWQGPTNYVGYSNMAGLGCTDNARGDTTCLETDIVFPTILIEQDRGHTVRWNYAQGGNDSFIRTVDGGDSVYVWADTSTKATNDMSVYGNTIINMGDDVFEPDGAVGKNSRIYKNLVLGGHTAMNWEVFRGPFYYIFNTHIHGDLGFLPHGNDLQAAGENRGQCLIANNTIWADHGGNTYAWDQAQNGDHDQYVNMHVWNNLLAGSAGSIYETGTLQKNDFNWNLHANIAHTFSTQCKYSSRAYNATTLQAWRDSTYGYGANDATTSSLQFADTTKWEWGPQRSWAAVVGRGAARSIPGVNTNLKSHVDDSWAVSDSTFIGAWP